MARKMIIALAGLAASLGIAVGLAAAGFAPAAAPISVAPASVVSGGEPVRTAVEPEVVYIKPAPKRRSIVRTVTDRPQRSTDFIAARPDEATTREHEDREHEDREHEDREHESGEGD